MPILRETEDTCTFVSYFFEICVHLARHPHRFSEDKQKTFKLIKDRLGAFERLG